MNALVKKEIRLLLPNFAIASALTASNLFLPHKTEPMGLLGAFQLLLPFVVCPVMALVLALSAFGGEISAGTFGMLLSQPVPRQKIWDLKIALLAGSLFLIGLLWIGFGASFYADRNPGVGWLDVITAVGVFGLVLFSGGLWTVLLLRQVAAAVWFTILIPAGLLLIPAALGGLMGELDDHLMTGLIVVILGLYSLAGFFLARWLFFRAQDLPWSGGNIVLPELGWTRAGAVRRVWRPRLALLGKELQLHQAQYVVAGLLLGLHLAALVTRHLHHFQSNSDTLFVFESVWMLWLVVPLLMGAAAVAEERKLGTLTGQLCGPAGRRTQFAIKILVVLGLSVVFGAAMPVLLEGFRILPGIHIHLASVKGWTEHATTAQLAWYHGLQALNVAFPALMLGGIAAGIGVVAFYASTLTRNLLQALAPAVMGVLVAGVLLIIATDPLPHTYWFSEFFWTGALPYFIALPIMTATLLVLADRNYQRVQINWQASGVNGLTLLGALALGMVLTAAVYHRAWEKFTPFEPAHGPARLTLSDPPRSNIQWRTMIVHLPDGKTWAANLDYRYDPLSILLGNSKFFLRDRQFLAGSNWVSVNSIVTGWVGLQSDGTLWVAENPLRRQPNGLWEPDVSHVPAFAPLGTETNWRSAAPAGHSVVLVKNDGSLWRWGPKEFNSANQKWPGLASFTPERLGTESDWAAVTERNYRLNLSKTDGTVWEHDDGQTNRQKLLEIEPGMTVYAVSESLASFRSVSRVSNMGEFRVGVRNDGTFRIYADQRVSYLSAGGTFGGWVWKPADLPLGSGSNWLAVAGDYNEIVTLKADGTLWQWDFHDHYWQGLPFDEALSQAETEVLNTTPTRLGTHSDWVAIAGGAFRVVALAADGSVWYWPLTSVGPDFDGEHTTYPLLDNSRKPQYLGNIFSGD